MGFGDAARCSPSGYEVRSVPVPARSFGHGLIVARPVDGAPVVLPATAASVLRSASDWSTREAIDLALADLFPDVNDQERLRTLDELLCGLIGEGLLERR